MTQSHPSTQVYSRPLLSIYDVGVHILSNRLLWHCPKTVLIDWYRHHLAGQHLEIGPGTGSILYAAATSHIPHQLTLLDTSANSLLRAATILAPWQPTSVQASVLDPLPVLPTVASIGLGYVLHCLPATLAQKQAALAHLAAQLIPGGCLFGFTLLSPDAPQHTAIARRLLQWYNAQRIFTNIEDTQPALEQALACTFPRWTLTVRGGVALFAGYAMTE